MDWAVELFVWFEYYLKDIGEEPEPMVQIQTHDGQWHVEETWPPEDMMWQMESIGTEWNGDGVVNGLGGSVTLTNIAMSRHEDGLHLSGYTRSLPWTRNHGCTLSDGGYNANAGPFSHTP